MTLFPTYFYKIMKAANPLVARVAASFYLFKLSKSGLYNELVTKLAGCILSFL